MLMGTVLTRSVMKKYTLERRNRAERDYPRESTPLIKSHLKEVSPQRYFPHQRKDLHQSKL